MSDQRCCGLLQIFDHQPQLALHPCLSGLDVSTYMASDFKRGSLSSFQHPDESSEDLRRALKDVRDDLALAVASELRKALELDRQEWIKREREARL